MRVAGTHCDATKSSSKAGLAFVLREWIGDIQGGGQLGYFADKASDKVRRHPLTERSGLLSLLTSVGETLTRH